jgi:hypothetical protein
MSTDAPISEVEILSEVVEPNRPTFSSAFAEELLAMRFNENAMQRMRDLIGKNNAGAISPAEKATLGNYLRVGEFLDLLQAKARLALLENGSTRP